MLKNTQKPSAPASGFLYPPSLSIRRVDPLIRTGPSESSFKNHAGRRQKKIDARNHTPAQNLTPAPNESESGLKILAKQIVEVHRLGEDNQEKEVPRKIFLSSSADWLVLVSSFLGLSLE